MSEHETPQDPAAQIPQQQVVVVQQRGNGMAVAGFVCGLLGAIFGLIPILFFLSFPLGILGLIFSVIARRRAKREPDRGGKGLATAGIVLSLIGIVLAIVSIAIIGEAADDLNDELERIEEELEQNG